MSTWRSLEDYSPFARVLVTYMWEQRPPLLPSQFAVAMGVRKQQVSSWLTTAVVPDPPLVVHLARQLGMPVRDLLIVAGHAQADDPLLDTIDAWTYVRQQFVQFAQFAAALAGPQDAEDSANSHGTGEETEEIGEAGEAREDSASRAARSERLMEIKELIALLDRLQPFAEQQRQLSRPLASEQTPVDAVGSSPSAGDSPSLSSVPDATEPSALHGDAEGEVEGATTSAQADAADAADHHRPRTDDQGTTQ